MKAAFHFDAGEFGGYYGPPVQELVFRALMKVPRERRHFIVYTGDLIAYDHISRVGGPSEMFALLMQSGDWSTLDPTVMTDALVNKRVYVLLVEGLLRQDAEAVEIELRGDGYFGALDDRPRNPVHWLLYDQSLIRKFRVVGDELRLFYDATLEEVDPGSRDEGSFAEWRQRAIFADVEWEEHGLRGTIFDQYDTLENAQRLGELEDHLSGRLGAVVNEIVLRSRDLDPVLLDALHAALAGFASYQSEEQLAQVAISCRRFLERLANALYPPLTTKEGDRKLGQAEYRNRLWAYVDKNLSGTNRDLVLATLEDVGNRIDGVDALANKGLHAPRVTAIEVDRLLVGLVLLVYDILMLQPPPKESPLAPYEESVREFFKDAVGKGGEEAPRSTH
jgi:hypothetical protein